MEMGYNNHTAIRATRTVDGGYLYRGVKIVHLVEHGYSAGSFREWLIEWPDGTHTDWNTLQKCREEIDKAFKSGDRGIEKRSAGRAVGNVVGKAATLAVAALFLVAGCSSPAASSSAADGVTEVLTTVQYPDPPIPDECKKFIAESTEAIDILMQSTDLIPVLIKEMSPTDGDDAKFDEASAKMDDLQERFGIVGNQSITDGGTCITFDAAPDECSDYLKLSTDYIEVLKDTFQTASYVLDTNATGDKRTPGMMDALIQDRDKKLDAKRPAMVKAGDACKGA